MRSIQDWQLAKSTIKIGSHHAKFKYIIHNNFKNRNYKEHKIIVRTLA
jgi:D-ribose pyranose/furanose isomerase RbsD